MNRNAIYVGLDVDDTQYHGAAFDQRTGEIISFKCRPTLKGLVRQLEKLEANFKDCHLVPTSVSACREILPKLVIAVT